MNVPFICVLIAAIFPYIFAGYAKFSGKGYNNSDPRTFLDRLEGRAKRAHYVQLNSFEAFPAFAAAVIMANMAVVPQSQITACCIWFLIFRTLYAVFYLLDKPSPRTFVWFGGFFCVIALFVLAFK